jgi:hypothetical protein
LPVTLPTRPHLKPLKRPAPPAGIDRDLTRRRLDCLPDDVDAVLLVLIFTAQASRTEAVFKAAQLGIVML